MCKPKICSTCKLIKPLENVHKYKNSPDGYTHRCKECVSRKKITQTNLKKCTICNIEKQLSDYHKRKYGKLGYDSTCKDCRNKKLIIFLKFIFFLLVTDLNPKRGVYENCEH